MSKYKFKVVVEQINTFYIETESEDDARWIAASHYLWDDDQGLIDTYQSNITVYNQDVKDGGS